MGLEGFSDSPMDSGHGRENRWGDRETRGLGDGEIGRGGDGETIKVRISDCATKTNFVDLLRHLLLFDGFGNGQVCQDRTFRKN